MVQFGGAVVRLYELGPCGNGGLDPGEECDDGNEAAGDGCSPFCFVEECGNGLDDDGDGLADGADPGCASASDPSEKSLLLPCDDGADNDGDSLTDYPADPGCTAPADTSEAVACSDGLDNDGQGLGDHPADPGCAGPADDSERGTLQCDDGVNDDGDAWTDYSATPGIGDPGCRDPYGYTERPQCQDGFDNDRQFGVDFDGGASVNGSTSIEPDPQCVGQPWRDREGLNACGLGFEIALLLAPLSLLRRRRPRCPPLG
jgi:cysteine-rich repeat protein